MIVCQKTNIQDKNKNMKSKQMTNKHVVKTNAKHITNVWFLKFDLKELKNNNQILFKYSSEKGLYEKSCNPNGSMEFIAGISNKEGNVVGMLPHPERCCESILGSTDGAKIFNSIISNKKSS